MNHQLLKLNIPYLYILMVILFFTGLLSYPSFAQGFDFTDLTLTYHYSLKILNGDVPFRDFHTTIMPLSYYIEALFHYVFGKNYEVNLFLGVGVKFLNTLIIFSIINYFYKSRIVSLLFALFITTLFIGNSQSYFNFTPFSITLSLATMYIALRSINSNNFVLVLLGIFTALTFLTKQNFGVVLLLAYILFLLIAVIKKEIILKDFFTKLSLYSLGLFIILAPFFMFYNYMETVDEVFYILMTGSQRKGLLDSGILSFIDSLIPIQNMKFFGLSLISTAVIFLIMRTKSKKIFLITTLSIMVLSTLSIFEFKYTKLLLEIIFYDSVKFFLIIFFLYQVVFIKQYSASILLLTIFTLAIIFGNELGWVGRGYTTPLVSSIFILLLPHIMEFYKLNDDVQSKINTLTKLIFYYLITFIIMFLLFAKDMPRRDFTVDSEYSLAPYLENYKMSSEHKSAIEEFRRSYKKNCENKDIFVFPWSPIIYDLLNANNPTRFDLPYHDWLTESEADEAMQSLKENPPCMLIIEEASLSANGKNTPFPAKGMKKLENYFKKEYLNDYQKIKTIPTYGKNHILYIK